MANGIFELGEFLILRGAGVRHSTACRLFSAEWCSKEPATCWLGLVINMCALVRIDESIISACRMIPFPNCEKGVIQSGRDIVAFMSVLAV